MVYRGRRRWDRGPDFAGALIAWADSTLRSGDVELHVRSSDWRAHGHHRDPHYNRVILQVVLWHDADGPTLREDGVVVPILALEPHLTDPLETLTGLPSGHPPRPSPCWHRAEECDGALGELLDRCGLERFAARSACFESDLTCCLPDQLLYQGIAEALGYSQNRRPFRRLAELVPLDLGMSFVRRGDAETGGRGDGERGGHGDAETRRRVEGAKGDGLPGVEGLLLGAAGLLPSQRGLAGDGGYAALLGEIWATEGMAWIGDSMLASDWEFFRVRPINFPPRRVAGLALLVSRWPEEGLAETLASLVRSLRPRVVPRALESLLLGSPRGGYWADRCDFGLRLRRPADLIGRQRAAEVGVNVFLPFLAGWASHLGDGDLVSRSRQVYRLYPKRGDNEITRYMAVQIAGIPRPRVARSACRQQGLLHLYWRYCETKMCGECPIREAPGLSEAL